MVNVILLSGKQGSGKTTLQKELVRVLNSRPRYKTHVINFADPLRLMHDFCLRTIVGLGVKRDIVKDGPLLQLLGTEWGRATVDPDIWVAALKGKIKNILGSFSAPNDVHHIFIVGDCRFKNELFGIPGALRVRLECDRETRRARCEAWRPNDNHPSETDLDDCLNRFDLTFDTAVHTPSQMANLIAAQIDKGVWLEKRV